MSSAKSSSQITNIDRVVEGLYCSCYSGNASYTKVRDNITLSNFANAIGGTLHLPKQDALLMAKLAETHADFLPGGKYELGYTYLARSRIESLLEVELNHVAPVTSGLQFSNNNEPRDDKYFICKSCCPVCRSASRGCPLHCCRTCWAHLCKLDRISTRLDLSVLRAKKLKKDQLEKFISSVTNDPSIPNGKSLRPNVGYFHNDMDIVFYLYNTYELDAEYCKSLIRDLSAM